MFERVCEQYLWNAGLAGALPFEPRRIGGWWRANEEIDLIALGDGAALVVECKWRGKPVGTTVLSDLERKATKVRALREREVHYGLCSRSGFTEELTNHALGRSDLHLYDLDRVVAANR